MFVAYPVSILVVDDEASDRNAMTEALRLEGHSVIAAQHYTDAIRTLEEHRDPVDVLVTDVALPGVNGCELAKAVLAQRPDTKVLFVSGDAGASVCARYGVAVPSRNFLRKPFSSEELRTRITALLANSESLPLVPA